MDPSVAQAAAYAAQFHAPPHQPPFAGDNHPATVAANPTPNNSHPLPSHPSYAEMITAAIQFENTQGKEGGSSKRAIAKYIDKVYSNLPPTHSALLSHHLKRLKNSGQLVMIKNSYQLPSFSPKPSPPQHEFSAANPVDLSTDQSPVVKRKPGRPLKAKSQFEIREPAQVQHYQPVSAPAPVSTPATNGTSSGKRPRGRPPKDKNLQQQVVVPFVQPFSEVGHGEVFVNSGVSNGQVQAVGTPKRRGRPPKAQQQPQQQWQAAVQPPPVFQVEVDMVAPEMVQPQQVYQNVPVNGVGVVKKRPGRPGKVKSAVGVGLGMRMGVGVGVGRGRGRPKMVNKVLAPVSDKVGKKRGWPRGKPRGKKAGLGVLGVRSLSDGSGVVKRPGRKPKASGPVVAKVEKKVYNGKPRGRPKRNLAIVQHTSVQETANVDLLMKLEDMQSKLRDAIGVLRPHFAIEAAPDAISALQQLEELSTMNVNSSPALIPLPTMSAPMDMTAPPQSTSGLKNLVASAPSLSGPSMMAYTARPGMNEPLPYSMSDPSDIVNEQPISWIPSNEA